MRKSSTRFPLSHTHINLSKLVKLPTSALFFHLLFPSHRSTRSSRITLSRPFLTSRLNIANRSCYHSAPVCGTIYRLIYVTLLIKSLRHLLNSFVSGLSTSLSSLFCILLANLRTDISEIDQASLFHLILISLSP